MLAGIFRGADRTRLGELIFEATEEEPYTIVWRMEDVDGKGVYSRSHIINANDWMRDYGTKEEQDEYFYVEKERPHPVPNVDFTDEEWASDPFKAQYLFAFPSPRAADKWFGPQHIRALAEVGVHLAAKKASKVYLSKSKLQVIYRPYRG